MARLLQEMSEDDQWACPLCVRALQQQERKEQRKAEAAAVAEIEREAREAQAARKAKLVCDSSKHDLQSHQSDQTKKRMPLTLDLLL